jgi:hypothetical protein
MPPFILLGAVVGAAPNENPPDGGAELEEEAAAGPNENFGGSAGLALDEPKENPPAVAGAGVVAADDPNEKDGAGAEAPGVDPLADAGAPKLKAILQLYVSFQWRL